MEGESCSTWLKRYLIEKGATQTNVVSGEAIKQGFTRSELKEARKFLGVKCFNDSNEQEEKRAKNWFWYFEESGT
ncbi:MAG: hypothetical protein RR012_01275 [Oscillospiraceae bacterium]